MIQLIEVIEVGTGKAAFINPDRVTCVRQTDGDVCEIYLEGTTVKVEGTLQSVLEKLRA